MTETPAAPSPTGDLTRISELKPLLARHGMTLSKRFGQNFLVSRPHLLKVVEAAELQPEDCAFEVGPGVGVLTRELAQRAGRVVAVELDKGLIPILAETLAPFPNAAVIQADALRLDLPALFDAHFGAGARVKIVANIPYNITSPLLIKLLEMRGHVASVTLMVQKEVARRLCAPPDADDYGSLSVFAQYHATVAIVATVPRGAFFPPPKVDSAVVHLVPHREPPVSVRSEAVFFLVSRAAFGQRRKTLANALTNAASLPFDKETIMDALRRADVDGQRRGETLHLAEIARIADALPDIPAPAEILFDNPADFR